MPPSVVHKESTAEGRSASASDLIKSRYATLSVERAALLSSQFNAAHGQFMG
jgi:hypothetical protein